MITNLILTMITTVSLGLTPSVLGSKIETLASREFSLTNRYSAESVNEVFKKNILLNLAYLDGSVTQKSEIAWDEVLSPEDYSFELKPGEVFAYHESVLPAYKGKVVKTTNAHFNASDGFLSDGYLYGDGVCHFASLINWAASDAGLEVLVTKNHDFAAIPDVPKQYGVSIYMDPGNEATSANRNLYITNNKDYPVRFNFHYEADVLVVTVTKAG